MSREQREQEMISGFAEITGSTADSSRFFLESANWNLELALANFYEGGFPGMAPEAGGDGLVTGPNFSQDINIVEAHEVLEQDDSSEERERRGSSDDNSTVVSSQTPPSTNSRVTRPRFATISSVRADSSSDEEEGQAYYAGGSEHSGQQVVGPSRPAHEIISDLFRSLRDQGGVEAISHEPGGNSFFSGTGYRLGNSYDTTSNAVNPGSGDAGSTGTALHREVILRLWRDGFSVDSGPLRSYNDPQEREFLNRIRRGNVPAELFSQIEGGAVHLSLEDHRHENFSVSAYRPAPFAGQGHVLGSAASEINVKKEETVQENKPESQQDEPASTIKVDNSLPITVIQIRLPDGDRLQITLNQNHTIGDLRRAVIQNRSQYSSGNFTLMTTFPRRELSDNNITIKDADILNSSLLLRQ